MRKSWKCLSASWSPSGWDAKCQIICWYGISDALAAHSITTQGKVGAGLEPGVCSSKSCIGSRLVADCLLCPALGPCPGPGPWSLAKNIGQCRHSGMTAEIGEEKFTEHRVSWRISDNGQINYLICLSLVFDSSTTKLSVSGHSILLQTFLLLI